MGRAMNIGELHKNLVFAGLLLLATPAFAGLDIELGRTWFGHQQDGTWYQERYPYTLDTEDNFFGIGWRSALTDKWDWRVGYANLGSASSNAIATSDEAYAAGCTGSPACDESRFTGHGSVSGISLTAISSSPGLFFEGGLYFFRAKWQLETAAVLPIPYPPTRYRHIPHWQIGTRLGVGYRIGSMEFLVSHYLVEAKGPGETETGEPMERIPGIYDVNKRYPGTFTATVRVGF